MVEAVVVVNDYGFAANAPARIAIDSALAMARQGKRVLYFCAVGPVDEALAGCPGIRVVCSGQPPLLQGKNRLGAAAQGLWNTPARRLFRQALAGLSPATTVVHFHMWTKALSPALFSIAARKPFAVCVTTHEYYTVCPNGALLHYGREKVCAVKPMSARCLLCGCDRRSYWHKLYRVARQLIQNRALRNLPKLTYLAVSPLNAALLGRVLPKEQIVCLPNYVRPFPPPPKPIHFAKNKAYLFIGRLEPEKGVTLFCEALAELGLFGIAIGKGPQPEDLDGLRARYPRVQFTGHLAAADMMPHIRRARALVFPSLWPEGMGLVPYEMQMHYHMPCVIANGSAPRELVLEGQGGPTGLLFATGSKADLKRALTQMQQDGLVAAMQQSIAGQSFARFAPQAYFARLAHLYDDILAAGEQGDA